MPSILKVLNDLPEINKQKALEREKQECERAEQERKRAERERQDPIVLFNNAISTLKVTIRDCENTLSERQQTELNNFIDQAEKVVSGCGLYKPSRVDELKFLTIGVNAIVNGELPHNNTLNVISKEKNGGSSIFDKKINRIMLGIAQIVGGILLVAAGIFSMTTGITTLDPVMINFSSVPFAAGAILLAIGIDNTINGKPKTVSKEINNILECFKEKELSYNNSDSHSFSNSASSSLFSNHSPTRGKPDSDEESSRQQPAPGVKTSWV